MSYRQLRSAKVKSEVVDDDVDVKPEIKVEIQDVKVEVADNAEVSEPPVDVHGHFDAHESASLTNVKMSDLYPKKTHKKEAPVQPILTQRQKLNLKRKNRTAKAQKKLVVAALEAAKTDDEKRDDFGNVICSVHPSNRHFVGGADKNGRQSLWLPLETELFYKVLAFTGTDFSMMQEYISFRTREECKKKYCKEERVNRDKVNAILANPCEFDDEAIESEIAELKARVLVERMQKHPNRVAPGALKPVKKEC